MSNICKKKITRLQNILFYMNYTTEYILKNPQYLPIINRLKTNKTDKVQTVLSPSSSVSLYPLTPLPFSPPSLLWPLRLSLSLVVKLRWQLASSCCRYVSLRCERRPSSNVTFSTRELNATKSNTPWILKPQETDTVPWGQKGGLFGENRVRFTILLIYSLIRIVSEIVSRLHKVLVRLLVFRQHLTSLTSLIQWKKGFSQSKASKKSIV